MSIKSSYDDFKSVFGILVARHQIDRGTSLEIKTVRTPVEFAFDGRRKINRDKRRAADGVAGLISVVFPWFVLRDAIT